jgi:hypothetical protein
MSAKGDFKKIRRRAEKQGWRVEKRKEYWMFFPPDPQRSPMLNGRNPIVVEVAGEFPCSSQAERV